MKFVCDAMLGKLAKYMRMLGLDTDYINNINFINYYKNDFDKPFLLTKRSSLTTSYNKCISVKSDHVDEQLREIRDLIKPFIQDNILMSRCIHCNNVLADAGKAEIEHFVPEYVLHQYNKFKTCPSCKKVYWQGSHKEHMMKWIEAFINDE